MGVGCVLWVWVWVCALGVITWSLQAVLINYSPLWRCGRYKHSLKKAEEASAQLAKEVRDLATGPLKVVVSEEMLTCLWPEEIVAAARGMLLHAMGIPPGWSYTMLVVAVCF